jgi:hypothetical protein
LAGPAGTGVPGHTINNNNLAFNADLGVSTDYAYTRGVTSPGVVAYSSGTNTSGDTSSTWTTPNGGPILWVRVSYSEGPSSNSSTTGYLQTGGGSNLGTYASSSTAAWVDISSSNTGAIRAHVSDDSNYYYATLTIHEVIYRDNGGEAAPYIQMSVIRPSGQLDATQNYWGGSAPATQVFETPSGAVDYSSFKLSPVAGAGPQ